MNIPEIQELIRLVEAKYEKTLHTSTDFDEFSLYLDRNRFGKVSASTLKRLWGYVNDLHAPRRGTLNVLSSYVGHDSFDMFVDWLKKSTHYNSSFFTAEQISSMELEPGDGVEIGWSPNRIVNLLYLGDNLYEVTSSINSKLKVADRFINGCFIKEQPMFLPYVIRDGEKTSPFIAGRNSGLTCIKVTKVIGVGKGKDNSAAQ